MATLSELQAQRTRILNEIERRGGKAKAPGFVDQLNAIDAQIRTARGTASAAQPAPAAQPAASSGFTVGATPEERAAQEKRIQTEIDRRGGPDKAPGFVAQLDQVKAANNPAPAPTTTDNGTGNGAVTDALPGSPVLNPADADILERVKSILGVGEDFGRRLGNEFYSDGALGRVAVTSTPEELAAMQAAKEFASTAGMQTDAVRSLLAQQQGILGEARQLSPIELEAIAASRAQLGGLDAPEMEGLRSQARDNVMGQYQSAARDLARAQASNQVYGAAATAQRSLLGQGQVREARNLERDLLVKNIDIKQAAQSAFNNLVTNTEANRAGRTNQASNTLASTTLGDESQRNSAKNAAVANQGNLSVSLGDRLRQLEEFNINQAAAERAGRIGSILGGMGTVTDQRGLLAGEKFAEDQYINSQDMQAKILEIIKDSLKEQKGVL